jgi:conjugative transfer ATPase
MRLWSWRRKVASAALEEPTVEHESRPDVSDVWKSHFAAMTNAGIRYLADRDQRSVRPVTVADERAIYQVSPSFVDRLPWVEYLPEWDCMLLNDGQSVAAFFELIPIGTEGRESHWFASARNSLENALQDSFDELDENPWVVQIFAQDETDWSDYLHTLRSYIQPRAQSTPFTDTYLELVEHHLCAISKEGGLFRDNTVTRLPWRGQTRRVRLVIYRRIESARARRSSEPVAALTMACERIVGGLANAGIPAIRLKAAEIHAWLLKWFNPNPTSIGISAEARTRFYQLTAYPPEVQPGEFELASGRDFAQRLFFQQPRSDIATGTWYFDEQPHRVVVLDRLRAAPEIGQITAELRKGDAVSAVFDQVPEGATLCLTLVVTPQDTLEAHLNHLNKKSVGNTIDSEQTRRDLQQARSLIGSAHKLYRGSLAFYLRGRTLTELDERTAQLHNVMLNAGLQPVREADEVAPCNSYLRWLPCCYNPTFDPNNRYTQLMFVQHAANLWPTWGRSRGTGHPGITFFSRGGGTITFDPLSRLDRQMNGHLFLSGPTGAGKSATLLKMLVDVIAVYAPRIFIVEAGNSFGLFGDYAKRLGLTVHRVRLAPGSGVSLAPFGDAWRLVVTPNRVQTLEADALDELNSKGGSEGDEQRDVLGELEITARLMITGGEEKEELRMTRADRSLIRQCILDAARDCVAQKRPVLTQDIRDALRARSHDATLPDTRRARLQEMADAMDIFCQGSNGDLFNRPGTPWPEADITIVDLATFAREGYAAELSIAYISLINTVNNIAERDQFLGRHLINVTDEGHIILKNPLLCPYLAKITKMWRKLMAWFWLSTQGMGDFPESAEVMLNMIEWWIPLSMPPDEVEKIARFRELTPAQKKLLLSARKQSGAYTEGVILSRSMEVLFRAVHPSLYLALAMTEGDEKNERYRLMQEHQIGELDAAIRVAERIDRARGIESIGRAAGQSQGFPHAPV